MIYKNVADQLIYIYAYTTVVTSGKTGNAANITATIKKDSGAAVATTQTNPVEVDATNQAGVYYFQLTQTETNADRLILTATSVTPNILIAVVIEYTETRSDLVASDVIAPVRRQLADEVSASQRWTDPVLYGYLTEAVGMAFTMRPDLFITSTGGLSAPDPVTTAAQDLVMPRVYRDALVNYCLWRALVEDSADLGNANRAQAFLNTFTKRLAG